MAKTDTSADAVERTDSYLIEKRGLYYRPGSAGYTGLKDEAGRYSLDEVSVHFPNVDSPNQDGMTYVHEDDAPDYSSDCAWDVRLVHKTRKEAQEESRATIEAQAKVIKAICDAKYREAANGRKKATSDRRNQYFRGRAEAAKDIRDEILASLAAIRESTND